MKKQVKPEPIAEERALPSSKDAEIAILGAILLDNSSYFTALDLEAEDFLWDSHRRIYLRMTDLMAEGKPIDFVTLTEILGQHKEMEAAGGLQYVMNLTDGLPRVKNIRQYADIVKEKAKLRKLIHAASDVIQEAYDGVESADKLVAFAERKIGEVIEKQEIDGSVPIFVNARDFTRQTPNEIDWIVEGIIERGANGLVVAPPKTGKSLVVLDLAIALAAGQSWMTGSASGAGAGFYVPRPVKVAMCAREDAPGLSKWRLKHLAAARQLHLEELEQNLWFNTKEETPRLMIDNPSDMRQLVAGLEKRKIEFLILDVFRRVHSADENDAEQMQRVIDIVCSIQEKVGCQVALIHHKRKENGDTRLVSSLTDSARGSSVIAGYAEWIAGIKVVNPLSPKHEWVREMEVELKAAIAPDKWFCRFIDQSSPVCGISVERVHWEPPKRGKKKADKLAADQEQPPLYPAEPESGDVPF